MMEKVVRMEKWRSNQTYSSARAMFLLPFLQHEILYSVYCTRKTGRLQEKEYPYLLQKPYLSRQELL